MARRVWPTPASRHMARTASQARRGRPRPTAHRTSGRAPNGAMATLTAPNRGWERRSRGSASQAVTGVRRTTRLRMATRAAGMNVAAKTTRTTLARKPKPARTPPSPTTRP